MVNFTTLPPGSWTDEFTQEVIKPIKKVPVPKPVQQDLVAHVVGFVTKSTKEPYFWERVDYAPFIDLADVPYNYEKAKKYVQQFKNDNDLSGVKVISYYTDLFNPEFNKPLEEYSYTEYKPKVKTFINGQKADKKFLASKGKTYLNKNGGV